MSAQILDVPVVRRPPPPSLVDAVAEGSSSPLSPAWCMQHLPLIDAAMDLLQADDAEFARRCALMADVDGRRKVDALAGQLERLGAHLSNVADALGLTSLRIRDAMDGPRVAPG